MFDGETRLEDDEEKLILLITGLNERIIAKEKEKGRGVLNSKTVIDSLKEQLKDLAEKLMILREERNSLTTSDINKKLKELYSDINNMNSKGYSSFGNAMVMSNKRQLVNKYELMLKIKKKEEKENIIDTISNL